MEIVEIETARGKFTLEVGEDRRAFLWLFHLTQDLLNKSDVNVDVVADRLVRVSGSNPRNARDFAAAVADIAQGSEPAKEWGIWAGHYAKKFAAEKCKRDIRFYLLVLIAGLAGAIPISLLNPGFDMDEIYQILLFICSLLTVFGFFKTLLLSMDWFSFRKSAWPE